MVPRAKYRGVNTVDSLPSQVVLETSFFTFDILQVVLGHLNRVKKETWILSQDFKKMNDTF